MAVYTCSGQMFYRYSSNMVQRAHSLLRRPLAPNGPLVITKTQAKSAKRSNLHLLPPIARPPGGALQKRPCQFVRLAPKMLPTKFHPNLLTFGNTYWEKTGERRRTPPYSMGRFATQREGLCPPVGEWGRGGAGGMGSQVGLLRDPSSLPEPPWR